MTYKLFLKKFQKNLVNSKNSSTFAVDFADNSKTTELSSEKMWSLKSLINQDVVQASNKMLKLGKNKFPLISTLN